MNLHFDSSLNARASTMIKATQTKARNSLNILSVWSSGWEWVSQSIFRALFLLSTNTNIQLTPRATLIRDVPEFRRYVYINRHGF